MKSYFMGTGFAGSKDHMIQYFDGQRLRQSYVRTYQDEIISTERTIPGILEPGMSYRTAYRRLASYEERCTRRIG